MIAIFVFAIFLEKLLNIKFSNYLIGNLQKVDNYMLMLYNAMQL